jgi:hypothetical protein
LMQTKVTFWSERGSTWRGRWLLWLRWWPFSPWSRFVNSIKSTSPAIKLKSLGKQLQYLGPQLVLKKQMSWR